MPCPSIEEDPRWRRSRNIEAPVRYAAELGYEVTLVKDATADYSDEMMHAALDINMPNYASAIVTTKRIVEAISALQPMRMREPTCAFANPMHQNLKGARHDHDSRSRG